MPATIHRPSAPAARRRGAAGATIVGALLVSLALPIVDLLEDRRRVDLVIVNDSPYDLGVRLRRADGAVLHVAHVKRVTTRVVRDVLHPGGEVEVIWTHQGRPVAATSAPDGAQLSPPEDLSGD